MKEGGDVNDESKTSGPGICPAEFGGNREDCAAWPACGCKTPPLYHIKIGSLTQEQRDQRWAHPMTVTIFPDTEGEA